MIFRQNFSATIECHPRGFSMTRNSRRLFPRQACHHPIKYRSVEMDGYSEAIVYNYNKIGMYFETQAILMPSEGLHIIMSAHSQSSQEPENFLYYTAQTVWCKSISGTDNPMYGCGARLIKRSKKMDEINAEIICHTCDMCDLKIPCQDLCRTKDFLYLCPSCGQHLNAISEGKIKGSIKRFLIGNVI
jgi:hypothetical protein